MPEPIKESDCYIFPDEMRIAGDGKHVYFAKEDLPILAEFVKKMEETS